MAAFASSSFSTGAFSTSAFSFVIEVTPGPGITTFGSGGGGFAFQEPYSILPHIAEDDEEVILVLTQLLRVALS